MTLRAALLSALCLCACEAGAKPATVPVSVSQPVELLPVASTQDVLPPSAADDGLPAEPLPEAESRSLRFRVASAQAPAAHVVAAVGEILTVGASSSVLDLEDGTRVTVAPNSRLCVVTFAKTLLLVSGQMRITRFPDAERAGAAPARIASFAGALETSPGADLELRVEVQAGANKETAGSQQRAQLTLLRGAITWSAMDEHGVLKTQQVSAESPLPKPPEGMQWSSPVVQAKSFQALRRVALRAADMDRALDAALLDQQALRERGHVLLARVSPRHAALAKAPADAPDTESTTREYQRALVQHARRQNAQASQLLLAAERSLIAAFAECGMDARASCASLQDWSARYSARVAELF